MKNESVEASAQAIAKAEEMRKKMIELFNRVEAENLSIQEIVRSDLQATGKWNNEQIEKIVTNLQKGIQTYKERSSQEGLSPEQLDELLKDKSAEYQKERLIAALSIMAFIEDTNSDLTQLRNEWEMMSVEALKDKVIAHVNKSETYNNVIDQLKEGMENFDSSPSGMQVQYGELSEDYKLYVAAQIFIEADDINIEELETQAQMIGATSAAAVDVAYETARWQNGEISEKTWHAIVKGILVVLAVCIISLIAILTSVDLLLNVVLWFTAIFGFSGLSVFLAMILGYAVAGMFLYLLYKGFETSDSGVVEDIDAFIGKCCCKVDEWLEKARVKMSDVWENLKKKLAGQEGAIEGGVPAGTEVTVVPPTPTPQGRETTQPITNPIPVPTSDN